MNSEQFLNKRKENLGIASLSDRQLHDIAEEHISTADYLLPPQNIPSESITRNNIDHCFNTNQEIWSGVIKHTLRSDCYIRLENFLLFEWLPRSPGLYFTRDAREARKQAERDIENVEGNLTIYNPYGKGSMINGGIGNIRLKPIIISKKEYYLMSASSSGSCHEGFPIAVSPDMYKQYIGRITEEGFVSCSLIGKLKFIPDELDFIPDNLAVRQTERLYKRFIPKLYLFIEEIITDDFSRNNTVDLKKSINVTVAVSFIDKNDYQKQFASFVTFFPNKPGSFKNAVLWMEEYVNRYNGEIITDFDQQQNNYPDALFSLDKVMNLRIKKEELTLQYLSLPEKSSSDIIKHQDLIIQLKGDLHMNEYNISGDNHGPVGDGAHMNEYNISGDNHGPVGDGTQAYNVQQNQTSPSEKSSVTSVKNESSPSQSPHGFWAIVTILLTENPLIFGLIAIVAIVGIIYLVASGKGQVTPGGLKPYDPNQSSTTESEKQSSGSPKISKVRVNYYCTWRGQGVQGNAVRAAGVTATSFNGEPISLSQAFTDDLGLVYFDMKRNDEVQIKVQHPKRKDSQIPMTAVKINETDAELKERDYTVKRTSCQLDY